MDQNGQITWIIFIATIFSFPRHDSISAKSVRSFKIELAIVCAAYIGCQSGFIEDII